MTSAASLTAAAAVLLVLFVAVSAQPPEDMSSPSFGVGQSHCRRCSPSAWCEYRGMNSDSQQTFECVCKTNYEGDGLVCTPVNPCTTGSDNCDSNARCIPADGFKYNCTCHAGYTGDGVTCTDVNECAKSSICDLATSTCVNTIGGYECVCKTGFVHLTAVDGHPDRSKCIDANECMRSPCPQNSTCVNTFGSFSCNCFDGFMKSAGGTLCLDYDECTSLTPHPCDPVSTSCINLVPGYECQCKRGFANSGPAPYSHCEDVNECLDTNSYKCPTNSLCVNNVGSYECSCNQGFQMTTDGLFCIDVNECADDHHQCDLSTSTCTNLEGDHECTCNSGYAQVLTSNKICADVDECAMDSHLCSEYATCINTIGGYNCTCFYGYTGDGLHCAEMTPSLSDLEASIFNLSNTELLLKLYEGYYENLELREQLEKYKRLCPLKQAGLILTNSRTSSRTNNRANNRAKRDIMDEVSKLVGGNIVQQKLILQTLLHLNSELKLQIALLRQNCGLE